MTFAAPLFLAVGIAAGAIVFGLHLISMRDDLRRFLPTARFIPDTPAVARVRTIRPSDILLMIVRALALMLIALALTAPTFNGPRRSVATIVMADASRAARGGDGLADSVSHYAAGAVAVLRFDTTAADADQLTHGGISRALVDALRVAGTLRDRADSIRLVVISPFAADAFDEATDSIRALWPGRIQIIRVAATSAGAAPLPKLVWQDSVRSTGVWEHRPRPDTIGAVGTVGGESAVVVLPFDRAWRLNAEGPPSRVIARWSDGDPAAIETAAAGACTRYIGFTFPTRGDVLLRPEVRRFLDAMRAPCSINGFQPVNDARLRGLAGSGALAAATSFTPPPRRESPLTPWLLLAAALLLAIEPFMRRPAARTVVQQPAVHVADATREAA